MVYKALDSNPSAKKKEMVTTASTLINAFLKMKAKKAVMKPLKTKT